MSSDRRAILALIAMGRITPAEAERLLAQLHLRELLPVLKHLVSSQIPALGNILGALIGVMGGLL